jgi:hypothetical protein
VGRQPAACRVQRQLADGDTHSCGSPARADEWSARPLWVSKARDLCTVNAEVAEAEDSGAVGDDDDVHVAVRPVVNHR